MKHRIDTDKMSKLAKTLDKVLRGNADNNIRFGDLRALLLHLDFSERVRGDHHIFTHENVAEILNLQPKTGKAKAYQVKQVRGIISSYGLAREFISDESADDEASSDEESSVNNEKDGKRE